MWKAPSAVVMVLVGLGIENRCADDGQQQFSSQSIFGGLIIIDLYAQNSTSVEQSQCRDVIIIILFQTLYGILLFKLKILPTCSNRAEQGENAVMFSITLAVIIIMP
jgi:hypothetical protein